MPPKKRIRVCRRCGTPVEKSPVKGYRWFCPEHYEDLYEFETELREKPREVKDE